MQLGNLSSHVLNEVLSYLKVKQILRLTLLGNPTLMHKLSEGGGIRTLRFTFNSNLRTFKWPSVVSKLAKLRHISVEDFALSCTYQLNMSDLLSLPCTVRDLELHVSHAYSAFRLALQAANTRFLSLKRLVLEVDVGEVPEHHQMDVKWPPFIETLHLLTNPEKHCDLDVSLLPSSLTNLRGAFRHLVNSEGGLPRSLISIALVLEDHPLGGGELLSQSQQLVDLVPPNVHHLSISVSSIEMQMNQEDEEMLDLSLLPSCLLSLRLPISNWSPSLLVQLPSSLETLHCSQHVEEHEAIELLALLPPRLTEATVLLPRLVTKNVAKLLPRSLHSFSTSAVEPSAIPYLPYDVNLLKIRGPISELIAEMKFLKMVSLPLTHAGGLDVENLNLTAFHLELFEALQFDTLTIGKCIWKDNLLAMMPQSLTRLSLHGTPPNAIEEWACFPHTLISLQLSTADRLDFHTAHVLPETLKSIMIFQINHLNSNWFAGLPPSMEKISVPRIYASADFASKDSLFDEDIHNQSLDRIAFPPSLQQLSIGLTWLPVCGISTLFRSLPCGLLDLSVCLKQKEDSLIRNSDLKFLPRCLERAVLPASSRYSPDGAKYLPTSLLSLSVGHKRDIEALNAQDMCGRFRRT